jgi:hypothetical protein
MPVNYPVRCGCNAFQGYWFSRPLPGAEVYRNWIKANRPAQDHCKLTGIQGREAGCIRRIVKHGNYKIEKETYHV